MIGFFKKLFRRRPRVNIDPGIRYDGVLADVPKGRLFAIADKPRYPKLKLERGYFDLSFEVRHLEPNPNWPIIYLTEEQVFKLYRERGVSDMTIVKALEEARTYLNEEK